MTILINFVIIVIITTILISLICGYLFFYLAIYAKSNKSIILKKNRNKKNNNIEQNNGNIRINNYKYNKKSVYIKSDDGLKLHSNLIEYEDNRTFVILIHGYNKSSASMEEKANIFYNQKGYSILLPDLRASGKSEGKYIGMGWLDRLDILKWIDYLNNTYQKPKIILYGISMGAATVMMTLGEKLSSNVRIAIEDCGYSSVSEQFEYELKNIFHFPIFPILYIANKICKVKVGYSFYEASATKQLENNKIPVLFIHGIDDRFVPKYMLDKVYNSTRSVKEKLIVEDAGHGQASIVDKELYWKTVFNFIDNNIN